MTETLTLSGANALAKIIREFWAKQGKTVSTTIEEFRAPANKESSSLSGPLYAVRSNMVGGLPPR